MGVEEALQTNETVDIFQEESLIRNWGERQTVAVVAVRCSHWPLVETVCAQLMFGLRLIKNDENTKVCPLG